MKMRVDLGKVSLASGQRDSFFTRRQGPVESSSGSDIRAASEGVGGWGGGQESLRQLQQQ